ncbi:MAG: hypothetical protein ACPGKG_04570 [Paracoccaceae bacterium]
MTGIIKFVLATLASVILVVVILAVVVILLAVILSVILWFEPDFWIYIKGGGG